MRNKFKTFHSVINALGSLLIINGFLLLIPFFTTIIFKEYQNSNLTVNSFFLTIIISFALGTISKALFRYSGISKIQAVFICSLGWIVISLLGSLPFIFIQRMALIDAFFETVSGFTTTGITMIDNIPSLPRSLLIWRQFIQWVGGLGILTFFLVVFSRSGEHKIFTAETHKINMKRVVPGMHHSIRILWIIYISFTILIALLLFLLDCSIFDSISHALTTLSTGGYSPYDASIGHYAAINHPHFKLIEYVIIFGMFLGGTNFLIHYRLIKGDVKSLWDNLEIRYWLSLIALFVVLVFLERLFKANLLEEISNNPMDIFLILERNFRKILFQVLAIFTTTGYATQDINSIFFGHMARQLFLIMMFIGGCVGSTSGGFKVMRIAILFKMIKREVYRFVAPKKAITYLIIDEKSVERDEIFRIGALFFAWILLLVIGGMVTAFFSEFNGYKSFSGMFSALGNIGPSFMSVKETIALNPFVKFIYIIGMLAGRLEILPILLLFNFKAWKY